MALDSVLITGCSSGGIGSSLALAFNASGLHVFATARDSSKLQHLAHLPNVTLIPLDVTSIPSISAAVEVVKKTNDGKLKYLINNSGRGMIMPLLDVDIEEAKKLFDVNLWGPLIVTKAFGQLIVESKGTVVLVGSSAGVMGFPWTGIYSASKASLNLLGSTLRLELAPLGVKVITEITGIVRSNFFANQPPFILPSDSLYQSLSLEESIKNVAKGGDLPPSVMSGGEYAERLVKKILGGKTGNTYTGSLAWSVKLLPFFPGWILDWYLRKRGGLS